MSVFRNSHSGIRCCQRITAGSKQVRGGNTETHLGVKSDVEGCVWGQEDPRRLVMDEGGQWPGSCRKRMQNKGLPVGR